MDAMGLCLTAMVFVPVCWGTSPGWISVDNQTYDTVYLSRVGDSNAIVLVPKRMIGQVQVPMVGQGVPALEALQVDLTKGRCRKQGCKSFAYNICDSYCRRDVTEQTMSSEG